RRAWPAPGAVSPSLYGGAAGGEIRSTKSEIRSSKSQTNPKLEIPNEGRRPPALFRTSDFGFVTGRSLPPHGLLQEPAQGEQADADAGHEEHLPQVEALGEVAGHRDRQEDQAGELQEAGEGVEHWSVPAPGGSRNRESPPAHSHFRHGGRPPRARG